MPHRLPILDICVLAAYMAGTVAFGCWFLRKSRRPEAFMVAGGAVPAWAVGLGWAVYRFVQTQIRAPRPPRGMFGR